MSRIYRTAHYDSVEEMERGINSLSKENRKFRVESVSPAREYSGDWLLLFSFKPVKEKRPVSFYEYDEWESPWGQDRYLPPHKDKDNGYSW